MNLGKYSISLPALSPGRYNLLLDGWVFLPILDGVFGFLYHDAYEITLAVSLGDLRYKRFGVTPEPEVRTKLLDGQFS